MASDEKQDEQTGPIHSLEHIDLSSRGRVNSAQARWGHEAVALRRLQLASVAIPRTWVVAESEFVAFARAVLPRRHDLKTLIKLAGSADGEERCARAHERSLAEPLPDSLVEAVTELWSQYGEHCPQGMTIRPALVMGSGKVTEIRPSPDSAVGVAGPDAILAAIRATWAEAVLSVAVGRYARAGCRDVSVALLLQRTIRPVMEGLLQPQDTESGEEEESGDDPVASWLVGQLPQGVFDADHSLRPALIHPLAALLVEPAAEQRDDDDTPCAEGFVDDLPDELQSLSAALGTSGTAELRTIAQVVSEELGAGVSARFALTSDAESGHFVQVVSIGRVRQTRANHAHVSRDFAELGLASRFRAPAGALSVTVAQSAVRKAISDGMASIHCKIETTTPLVTTHNDRTYLNVAELHRAAAALPLGAGPGLQLALGAWEPHGRLGGTVAPATPKGRLWKTPLIAVTTLLSELRVEHETLQQLESMDREARSLADLDLKLLPNDGITTTFRGARRLLEAATELWIRWYGAQLVLQLAAGAVIRRRVPEAPPTLGMTLMSGAGGSFGASMGIALRRVADAVRDDAEVLARFRQGTVRTVRELPDGRSRGALGQFLSICGDGAFGAFDLARPRWSEDASDLISMVVALAASPAAGGAVPDPVARARAAAVAEQARYEPYLTVIDRTVIQALLDRCRTLMTRRREIDRWVLRALRLARRVTLDIDRRLRRIEPDIPVGGAFLCEPQRLVKALTSGRPELGQLIRMRLTEHRLRRGEAAPPTNRTELRERERSWPASLEEIAGIGASPGVVEGRALVVASEVPRRLEGDEVLVLSHADPALSPLFLPARAIVAETGGAMSPAADIAREFALPAVMGAQDATVYLRDGEPIRVDGTRGTIMRLNCQAGRRRRAADEAERP